MPLSGIAPSLRSVLRHSLARLDHGALGFIVRWWVGLIILLFKPFARSGALPLRPLRGLEEHPEYEEGLPLEPVGSAWVAIDADPCFAVALPWWRLPRGWCRVRVSVDALRGSGCVKLYRDSRGGFSERTQVLLGIAGHRGEIECVCFMPLGLRRLRLDPTEHAGPFSLGCLSITSLGLADQFILTLRGIYRRTRHLLSPLYWQLRGVANRPLLQPYQRIVDYRDWVNSVEPTEDDCDRMAMKAAKEEGPTFSIVMPVYNPELAQLIEAIASVMAQTYPHWELCICDDASTEPDVWTQISELAEREPRLKVQRHVVNGGIARASSAALTSATGDYIAFLDQDDTLARWALDRMARALRQFPEAALLYSDEDKIDENGQRCEPHFKPAWNPDLLHSINYFGHMLVVRRDLVEAVGGFRAGFDGSQDYDLVLRCVDAIRPDQIVHVPGVLYHWRKSHGSTAQVLGAKAGAHPSGIAALSEHMAPIGAHVSDGPFPTSYRVRYPMPSPAPLVSIMIPTRDGGDALERCIDSILRRTLYPAYEILIIDNQCADPRTLSLLSRYQLDRRVRVIGYDAPFNFSAVNNLGAKEAIGDVLLMLNDDVEVLTGDWLNEMVPRLYQPGVGAVGAKLMYPDGRIQHAGVILGVGGVAGHSHKYYPRHHLGYFGRLVLPQTVSAVTGACLLVKKADYLALGGLDEVNLAVAFNDVDFCLRLAERKLRTVWTPYAELLHFESLSRGQEDTPEKRLRFAAEVQYMKTRWRDLLLHDRSYNPCLTLEHEDLSLSLEAPHYLQLDAR